MILHENAKASLITEQAQSANIFIETGTYLCGTLLRVHSKFKRCHSVELSESLHQKALEKVSKLDNITLHLGDSGEKLREILQTVDERCVFWLDAHYSSGLTALGAKETPILEELSVIRDHNIKDHIILVDDIRCFDGTRDYPTIEDLRLKILEINPSYKIIIADDIMRAHV